MPDGSRGDARNLRWVPGQVHGGPGPGTPMDQPRKMGRAVVGSLCGAAAGGTGDGEGWRQGWERCSRLLTSPTSQTSPWRAVTSCGAARSPVAPAALRGPFTRVWGSCRPWGPTPWCVTARAGSGGNIPGEVTLCVVVLSAGSGGAPGGAVGVGGRLQHICCGTPRKCCVQKRADGGHVNAV